MYPDFDNDTYTGKQNHYKPKREEEYASIDAKVVTYLMDSVTKQIKRIANGFSNSYITSLVQSEKEDSQLTDLRGNAVKVLDNEKIGIYKYNNSFQRILVHSRPR